MPVGDAAVNFKTSPGGTSACRVVKVVADGVHDIQRDIQEVPLDEAEAFPHFSLEIM